MAQELQDIKSIFDFFYVDTQKIKSFYAQLTGNGAITSLKYTSNIADGRQFEATAGVPLTASGKGGSTHTASNGSEHQYDATPTLPREMINKLDELGFIHRTVDVNSLGNLVLLEGTMSVLDVSVIKDLFNPAINFFMSLDPDAKHPFTPEQLTVLTEFIKVLPYSLEARLLVSNGEHSEENVPLCDEFWMTLHRDEMVGNPYDLNFKHGEFLSGQWYVLGVLDATPFDNFKYKTEVTELRQAFSQIATSMKEQFGRPENAYGITPVAIFRILKPAIKPEA